MSFIGSEDKAYLHVRLTALISGRVQRVGYRAFVRRHAIDMQLAGYAENLSDGRVEVVVEGPRHELDQLLVHLRRGPTHAVIDTISAEWNEASGLKGFYVY